MDRGQLRSREQGTGKVIGDPDTGQVSLAVGPTTRGYSNAQLDDYHQLSRGAFPWRPPVRLSLEARLVSEAPAGVANWPGTAGFGFWNAPFGDGGRWPALPNAVWFFLGGNRCNMAFAAGVPGNGWKAATIRGHSPWGYGLMPMGPLAALLFQSGHVYRALWPRVQRLLGIAEANVGAKCLAEWRRYEIEWGTESITFRIGSDMDNEEWQFRADVEVRNSLGLVLWLDNQYLVATPQGKFRWGVSPVTSGAELQIRAITTTNFA